MTKIENLNKKHILLAIMIIVLIVMIIQIFELKEPFNINAISFGDLLATKSTSIIPDNIIEIQIKLQQQLLKQQEILNIQKKKFDDQLLTQQLAQQQNTIISPENFQKLKQYKENLERILIRHTDLEQAEIGVLQQLEQPPEKQQITRLQQVQTELYQVKTEIEFIRNEIIKIPQDTLINLREQLIGLLNNISSLSQNGQGHVTNMHINNIASVKQKIAILENQISGEFQLQKQIAITINLLKKVDILNQYLNSVETKNQLNELEEQIQLVQLFIEQQYQYQNKEKIQQIQQLSPDQTILAPLVTQIVLQSIIDNNCLNVSQIEIYDMNNKKIIPTNLESLKKIIPSYSDTSTVSKAFDGKSIPRSFPDNYHVHGDFCKTKFKIIFKIEPALIKKIIIYNRSDCCSERLAQFTLSLLTEDNKEISTRRLNGEQVQTIQFTSERQQLQAQLIPQKQLIQAVQQATAQQALDRIQPGTRRI